MLQRVVTGDLDATEATARQALAVAEQAGDASAAAHALADLWLTRAVRRDHAAALGYLDRALSVLGDDPVHQDMRLYILDRPDLRAAEPRSVARRPSSALRQAREFARADRASPTGRPGLTRRSCGTGSASGTTRWPSSARRRRRLRYGYLRERWPVAADSRRDRAHRRAPGQRSHGRGGSSRRAWRCPSRTSPTGRTRTSSSPRTRWRWNSRAKPARPWRRLATMLTAARR